MRAVISAFDRSFSRVHLDSKKLLVALTDSLLYRKPREIPGSMRPFSCGEYIVRSAAMVEKTFGGITTRLWDDPYEWTLPEKLSSIIAVTQYLDEVETTRQRGFALLTDDSDLARKLPAPEKMVSVAELLLGTIAKAEHFQGRAFAVYQMLSDERLPVILVSETPTGP